MAGPINEFLIGDGDSLDRALAEQLPDPRRLKIDSTTSFYAAWHDTFDLRLTSAKVTLRCDDELAGTHWNLAEQGSAHTRSQQTSIDVRFARDLPEGPVRSRIEEIAGHRSLAVQLEAQVRRTTFHLVDDEEKTVARLVSEHATPREGKPWTYLRIEPMRGYESHARRLSKRILALKAAEEVRGPLLKTLAKGLGPGSMKPPRLKYDQPARVALGLALSPIAQTMRALLPGTIADLDPEFLHDLRVSVRRTRSALRLADGAFTPDEIALFSTGFSWLGEVTAPQRDIDVFIACLPRLSRDLPTHQAKHLQPFEQLLRNEREREYVSLQKHLRSPRLEHLIGMWERFLRTGLANGSSHELPELTVGQLADRSISQLFAELVATGAAITAKSGDSDLHALRKLGKRLRYAVELFRTLYPDAGISIILADLRALQEYLGAFQDLCVQRDGLSSFAHTVRASEGPTSTILAMGRLCGALDARVRASRLEFPQRFEEFTSTATATAFTSMIGAAR